MSENKKKKEPKESDWEYLEKLSGFPREMIQEKQAIDEQLKKLKHDFDEKWKDEKYFKKSEYIGLHVNETEMRLSIFSSNGKIDFIP